MRHWVMAFALVGCGGSQATTTQPAVAGPTCAEVGVHAAPLYHVDDATSDRIAASLAGHCDVDRWTSAARQCAIAARDHDGLLQCSYKHLTREQHDKVTASITPLVQPPREDEQRTSHTPPPAGGTQAEIAAHGASEGEKLYAAGAYEEASRRYMDAVARVPEPRYFYLLCQSRHREGKLGEALTACDGAERSNPDAALAVKIRDLRALIRSEAQKQGIKL